MTLSLINSFKDFNFVGWVIKTLCPFYFRSAKFYYVKETHMMSVAFWCWWKFLSHLSTKDKEKIFWRWLESARTPLCKWTTPTLQTCLSKTFANSPNKQKQQETIKNRFWLWLSIVWETQKLTRHQSKEFSYISLQNKRKLKAYASASRSYSFTARN